ncbi:Mitochondrial assembly of ribosomal large subunit protein isoform 1 [Schistosoma japonicum]|uniref:Mitochondrial assembly of ribosomal large subunit protein isoform 1 n=1 Tax=Schistosoma japonicum TaxID=6182 RepID=A0A4Z2CUP4_SCHJA|nr:Mitochondrial assembly of ribosomal large subunit protein isoform 1 [Schistosoma japonicum]
MLLFQRISPSLLTVASKVFPRSNHYLSGFYSTESKPRIRQKSNSNDGEEDTVFEVYDDHWEVDPVVEQIHIAETKPREQLSFIRMKSLFDVPELMEVLRLENIRDIVCLSMNHSFLAPYMVIGSGVTRRHVQNTAIHIHKLLKCKLRHTSLPIPLLHGIDGSCEWIAVDMSTIFLHLFLPSTRLKYDLESLWCAGAQYDDQLIQKNITQMPDTFNWKELFSKFNRRNNPRLGIHLLTVKLMCFFVM